MALVTSSLGLVSASAQAQIPFEKRACIGPAKSSSARPSSGLALKQSASSHTRKSVAARAAVATEPATGISFPPTLSPPGCAKDLPLLGAGVREKKIAIINVKVYAVGFYAELAGVDVSSSRGRPAEDVAADATVFASLANAAVEKAILIVLAMDVKVEQFVSALNDELAPRLQAAGASLDSLKEFSATFQGRTLTRGTAILLASQPPSTLQVAFADGVDSGFSTAASLDSAPLLQALLDVYLGPSTVSKTLLASVATTLSA